MVPIAVNSEFTGCSFQTPEGELSTVVELLKLHCSAKHRDVDRDSTKAVTKIEKAKRPEIALEMTDEDWAYFFNRWSAY